MNSEDGDFSGAFLEHAEGTIVRLHVQPGARRSSICGVHGDRIRVAISEPPEKGRATEAVRRLLADQLNLPVSMIMLVRGQTSRQKDVLLAGVTKINAIARMQECIGEH